MADDKFTTPATLAETAGVMDAYVIALACVLVRRKGKTMRISRATYEAIGEYVLHVSTDDDAMTVRLESPDLTKRPGVIYRKDA